jgi:hypothetical protein
MNMLLPSAGSKKHSNDTCSYILPAGVYCMVSALEIRMHRILKVFCGYGKHWHCYLQCYINWNVCWKFGKPLPLCRIWGEPCRRSTAPLTTSWPPAIPLLPPVLDVTIPSVIAYHVILFPVPILLQGSRLENSQIDFSLDTALCSSRGHFAGGRGMRYLNFGSLGDSKFVFGFILPSGR